MTAVIAGIRVLATLERRNASHSVKRWRYRSLAELVLDVDGIVVATASDRDWMRSPWYCAPHECFPQRP